MIKDGVFHRRSGADFIREREGYLSLAQECIDWAASELQYIRRRCGGGARQVEAEQLMAQHCADAEAYLRAVSQMDSKLGHSL